MKTRANGTEVEYVVDVYNPNISPDGTRMAFATLRHGDNYDIGVSNLDGSNYRRLTKTKSSEANPVWSPDGSQIVFIFNRFADDDFDDEGPAGLYIMDADGSDVRMLAPRVYGIGLQAWSPDGRTLAFLVSEVPPSGRYKDIRYYIHTVGRNGSNLTRLAESISLPAWSPDGTTIAFQRWTQDRGLSFFAVNRDGSGAREIFNIDSSHTQGVSNYLFWSPDGSEILSERYPFVAAKVDGSGYRMFNGLEGAKVADASWSRDGSRASVIVWYPDGRYLVFTMARDGSDKRSLIRGLLKFDDRRQFQFQPAHGEPFDTKAGWVWYSPEGKIISSAEASVLVGPPNSLPNP